MTKKKFTDELEWLRRRLKGHVYDVGLEKDYVCIEYVDARIDDLISTYGV